MNNEKLKRQIEIEESSFKRNSQESIDYKKTNILKSLFLSKYIEGIKKDIKENKYIGVAKSSYTFDIISAIGVEQACLLSLKEILVNCKDEKSVSSVFVSIGNSLLREFNFVLLKKEEPALFKQILYSSYSDSSVEKVYKFIRSMKSRGMYRELPLEQRVCIGHYMLNMAVKTTGLIEIQTRKYYNKVQNVICYSEEATRFINNTLDKSLLFEPIHYPCIVKPKQWSGIYGGGYITNVLKKEHNLIKARDKDAVCLLSSSEKSLKDVFNAVNAIQETAFKINNKILEIVKILWDKGGDIAGLPAREIEFPERFWKSEEERQQIKDTEEYSKLSLSYKLLKIKEKREKSKKFSVIYKIITADKFKDEEEIYFPCQLDWRGRIYPIPQFINFQSDDLGRALLLFAKGKKLSETGLKWLKIYTANCYGLDKKSFEERIAWVNNNLNLIKNIAEDPLIYKYDWVDADKPFLFLSCCMELKNVLENKDYESCLPVQVDGSNNGLQHLSALLLDSVGAKATNLIDSFAPADIYQEVADKLKIALQNDIDYISSDEEAYKNKSYANQLLPLITRKVVKRAVMTTPYGVTNKGIEEQFVEDLPKINEKFASLMKNENIVRYLRKKTIEAISETVASANVFKKWVQDCIKVFNKNKRPFIYTAPSGFVVYHKYNKASTKRVSTSFEKTRYRIYLTTETPDIDTTKQINGISPNIIHSLDASHMVRTIRGCIEEGITNFCMIHDSFGTHAEDMEKMNQILRKEFVDMYEEKDFCEYLYNEMKKQLPEGCELPLPPQKGNLSLTEVLKSKYFFA